MKKTGEQEKADKQAGLNQPAQYTQAQLETLSSEQLDMYLHEVKWHLKQLAKVIPDPDALNVEVCKRASQLVTQMDILREALLVERASRSLVYLQGTIEQAAAEEPASLNGSTTS